MNRLVTCSFLSAAVLSAVPAFAGERLYNGIVLPDAWPPRHFSTLTREPQPVPYLRDRPATVPIDVGRQLFVDDFLAMGEALTGLRGEDLKEAMAGIEAHSVNDRLMEEILSQYAPENRDRARLLAEMLKDADGLDRVRINDLNVKFLRRSASPGRGGFRHSFWRSNLL